MSEKNVKLGNLPGWKSFKNKDNNRLLRDINEHNKEIVRQFIIIITFTLFYLIGFAQKSDSLTFTELKKSGFEISNEISDFPFARFNTTSTKAFLATRESQDSYEISLLFLKRDSLYQKALYLEIKYDIDFKCVNPIVTYSDGFLKLECRWMKGIMFITKLNTANNELTFSESYQYDLNDEVYSKAEKSMKKDDPISFCEAYLGAQYYTDLNFRIKESLEWAHKKALKYFQNKEYKKAASIMLEMEQRCSISMDLYDFMGNEFIKIWSNVTLFYLKAEMYPQCGELAKRLIEIDPTNVGVYLQYGDALFKLQKINECKLIYNKYIDIMTTQGNKTKIPSRVYERLK